MNKHYDKKFYGDQKTTSERSAEIVLPYLINAVSPKSIVDFGCGVGTWLKVAGNLGLSKLTGIEGEWVSQDQLISDQIHLLNLNLNEPVNLNQSFDLAISLEVAEHLNPASSKVIVQNLVKHANMILFGAAIPGQRGVNHINEQYQSFWNKLFKDEGYEAIDCIRPKFWDNEDVGVAYRQNAFLYVKSEELQKISNYFDHVIPPSMTNLVHPKVLELNLSNPTKRSVLNFFKKRFLGMK